ncbi:MAG TPA: glutathione S-transferase family protein [Gammaproteobacteria bacterium]|nr:glutathione S-transferase family protein [Gammaproteobacteria bacterium]
MKLYAIVGSGNCRKVQATINNLGLKVDIEYLGLLDGDLATTEYLALNPNGRVPVLVDGDFSLWESNAIMQYLADRVPANALFPRDPQVRAGIVRWQFWETAHFNNALATVMFETVLKPKLLQQEPNPPLVDAASESLQGFARVLEDHLADRDYMVGDGITLADYSMVSIEGFKEFTPFDWSGYPRLNAYFDRLRADPYWAGTAPESMEAIGRKPQAA